MVRVLTRGPRGTSSIVLAILSTTTAIFFVTTTYFIHHRQMQDKMGKLKYENARLRNELRGARLNAKECGALPHLKWRLDMMQARSYRGITVPMNNGYSAKCIPEATMSQMNANYISSKLLRTTVGLSDGMPHADDNLLSAGQVGEYASKNMKFTDEGRPIWSLKLWNDFIEKLNNRMDGGPPGYRNSGKSISKAVLWTLEQMLPSCGATSDNACKLSVFSAISPWAEAIMFHAVTRLSRNNSEIRSVDFNPCVLDGIPKNRIAECISVLDLAHWSGPSMDLTVSYSGIEHDGLGRYGDPVNPNGDVSALREMWLLTRPSGILLLAVPCADKNTQPKTSIPIWGNGKIQVLQHRAYGAERYMRLTVGWELEAFVLSGGDVVERKPRESKLMTLFRMIQCSYKRSEGQPLLILRKLDNTTFENIMLEGEWPLSKKEQIEREYQGISTSYQNITCA